jgi:serine protease AprX
MKLDRKVVEDLIFGGKKLRRYTQDSPVLPDVWLRYAENPEERVELLLTPYGKVSSGELSKTLREHLLEERKKPGWKRRHGNSSKFLPVAYNQSVVLTSLCFDELVRVVLPLSDWWASRITKHGSRDIMKTLRTLVERKDLDQLFDPDMFVTEKAGKEKVPLEFIWMVRLIGAIEFCRKVRPVNAKKYKSGEEKGFQREDIRKNAAKMVRAAMELLEKLPPADVTKPKVYSVNLNRKAEPAITRSVPTIKADAASRLFCPSCEDLTWAIIDSGIDATHRGFRRRGKDGKLLESPFVKEQTRWKNQTRITATYDFTLISTLLNYDEISSPQLPEPLRQRMAEQPETVKDLRLSLNSGREIDWSLLLPFIEIPHNDDLYKRPVHEHGTHVAGILAGNWPKDDRQNPEDENILGVCPDINLYDLRVLNDDGEGDEFSVMAALQFLRYLNRHKERMVAHGVNLSLSIHHEVANYACGRTPVCEECERLVGAGIVVVAAAGNQGYLRFLTSTGSEEGYRSISITDPGNADGVITVGATHANRPHTYGVSYFSSRGPTGDGRLKPDLVAPGEKIRSLVPGNGMKLMDGTSMAAPHVSGAAALLMARHRELASDPERIKQILCETATDLGRERYFQGAGLVDILRALQSV